jgi:heterodisulfide reductase subunit B
MKLAYFPGCSAETTGRGYTESFMYVADRVGIQMQEIPYWNCCGTSAARSQSADLADALSARSLALSEATFGDTPVIALCAGCYSSLSSAYQHAHESEERRHHIEELIERPYRAEAPVINGVEPFLNDEVAQQVKSKVTKPLNGMKVACYYGCALLRPRAVTGVVEDEDPQFMEQVVQMTGAKTVDWAYKNECCGASHTVSVAKYVKPLVGNILENAVASGANAIATACPLCQLNLDMRQAEVNRQRAAEGKEPLNIPVYYFSELLAASFGAPLEEIGVGRHFVPAADAIIQAQAAEPEPEPETPEQAKARRIAEAKARAAAKKAAAAKAAASAEGAKPEAPAADAKPEAPAADAKPEAPVAADEAPAPSKPAHAAQPAAAPAAEDASAETTPAHAAQHAAAPTAEDAPAQDASAPESEKGEVR